MHAPAVRILGIDPGLATIGLGLIEVHPAQQLHAIDWLTIQTNAALKLPERLAELAEDIEVFLKDSQPHVAVVERLFFASNAQTAIDVAQARGVILQTIQHTGIAILEPTPLQLKAAITGDGRADKEQMGRMVMRMLRLIEVPKPDDAADALALAIYGAVLPRTTLV